MSSPPAQSLKKNSLTVVGSVAMCMAFMGPATSVAFNTQPAASGAGFALPLSILLALIACLLVGNTIAAFARKIPTSGFAYSYNTRGFGPNGGFLSGWLLLLAYGMLGPMLLSAIGSFSSTFIVDQFGVHIPWPVMTVAFGAVVFAINAAGVSESARAALIFLVVEVGVLLGPATTILGKGGATGITLAAFNPAHSLHGISGLGTGMLWGILMFIGFESVATLGEEAKSATKTIPVAVFSAVIVIGLFYVYTAFAAANGFGAANGAAFAADSSPWTTLAQRYWGLGWALALTVLASQFANFVSGTNAVVRVIFSMGREGILPRVLSRTSTRQVPLVALSCYLGLSLVIALTPGAALGPLGVYGFCGTILGLGMILIYILISIAVIRFYRREHPAEWRPVRHGVLPVLTVVIMLLPIYGQIYPTPASPNNLVPYLIVAWMVIGTGYLRYLRARRPELITAMGRVFEEAPQAQPESSAPVRTT